MPDSERGLLAIPPKDHLNRRLLMRQFGRSDPAFNLLELLCTDSVYVLKDDFDDGLSSNRWDSYNLIWEPDDFQGVLSSGSEDEDPLAQGALLRSRVAGWRPDRRPVFQARINFGTFVSTHFEMGFVAGDPGNVPVITDITSSAVFRNKSANSIALAVRDPGFTRTGFSVVAAGLGDGSTNATVVDAASPAEEYAGDTTLMVACNEVGECRVWVNGIIDNTFAEDNTMQETRGHHLRIFGASGHYRIDYVQAWQERVVV